MDTVILHAFRSASCFRIVHGRAIEAELKHLPGSMKAHPVIKPGKNSLG